MRKILYFMILLLLVNLVNIVNAQEWELTEQEGDWNYISQTLWESPYSSTYSAFEYTTYVNDFQHLKAIIYLESYDIGGYWEISKAHQGVFFTLSDANNTFTITFIVDYELKIHLLGIKEVVTSACVQAGDSIGIPAMPVSRAMYVEIHAWKRSDNKLVVAYMYKYDPNENATTVFNEEIIDVNPSWFENVQIIERVEKYCEFGAGAYIKGGLTTLELTSGSGFSSAPYSPKEMAWIGIYRRNFWFIDTLYQAGSFLWSMLTLLWNFIIPCLPLLFSVYGFYLLYLVVSCLEDGDFTRLYDHFIRIAQLFVSIIQAIFNAINTIISHFR